MSEQEYAREYEPYNIDGEIEGITLFFGTPEDQPMLRSALKRLVKEAKAEAERELQEQEADHA